MAENKKTTKTQLVTPRTSVHVVYLSCPHCGEEIEDIKLCPECGKPMKVIDVVEKFGEEAEKLLEELRKNTPKKNDEEEEEDYVGIDKEEPNIILMGGDTSIDDGGIDPAAVDEDAGLDVIFPDDGENSDAGTPPEALADDDLTKALDQLDEEEDTSAVDFGLGDDGVPEL